ncbi:MULTISPECIES: type I polyketide synthase [Streptomycetaceae]|uniref:Polyketide synthase n=1 Tax=Streptantibioticus cattleyicolor (strain ATCC 35852 / DSM 46488 / JCM 4925 / NBRC 14057 / NRRL 8057) TaxID=1003195 RepID=F8K1V8_STREN
MSAGRDETAAVVRRTVLARLRERYGTDPAEVTDDRPFAELGVTSRDAVALAGEITEATGVALPGTALWDAPTLRRLLDLVCSGAPATGTDREPAAPGPRGDTRIAVIGIGCRLPGGIEGPGAFWEFLTRGGDAVGTVPEDRWAGFAPPDDPALAAVSRHGAFLADVAGFDADFFGIAPQEAAAMDPQQRLLLEVAREALDHASVPAGSLAGSDTGVFVGISGNEYARLTTADLGAVDAWTPPGSALSVAAGRLSYLLDLRGPSMAVDTACSSSLVAVHHAVRSLTDGESDLALACGVNLLLSPAVTLAFQRAGALAPDGRCKAFDARADGIVRGEGCVVTVLKRLTDAQRDGDRILAVIRATAVGSDGRSNGLLAPNGQAQQALLRRCYPHHGPVDAARVDYVEAHGTGTALGDPIEAAALGAVLGAGRDPRHPLLIGSAKANLGHLEAAAGITGLARTALALWHDEIPPHPHFTTPSPHIDFDALRLRVVTGCEPWPRYHGTATAGVSAFGFGGTNAHVVLEEPPAPPRSHGPRPPAITLLDAPAADRVRDAAAELADWLRTAPVHRADPADVAHTLAGRTGRGGHRAAVVARDRDDTVAALTALAAGHPHPHVVTAAPGTAGHPGVVWVFSGYGSQWPGMGRQLLDQEPEFAAAVDRLDPLLRRHAGFTLREVTDPGADLSSPAVVQPALFALQVALAGLWRSYGVRPAAVIGHSMGEIAAAVAAGALDAETGVRVAVHRSRLLAGLSGGAMAVVDRDAAGLARLAGRLPTLRVAVHASPGQCVVTGSTADIDHLIAEVTADGGLARSLKVAAAGHSPQVDPLLAPLVRALGEVPATGPDHRFYTTVLDDPRALPAFDAGYWAANLRRPVRFSQAVTAAAEDGHRVFVEVSPHPTQHHPLAATLRAAGVHDPVILPTLRRGADETAVFRTSLAALLVHGVPAGPPRLLHPGARVTDVPSPRWRHRHHWVGAAPQAAPRTTAPGGESTDPLLDRVRHTVADVLGYRPEQLDAGRALTDLGVDSLMAARLRAAVAAEFGVDVPPRTLLAGGTLADVAALLAPAASTATGRIAPRDAAERLVAHAWQQAAGGALPGADDDLLDPAPGPAVLDRFHAALAERAARPLPPAELTRALATVAAVADRLRPYLEPPVDGALRTFHDGGAGAPLFLVHPAGGSSAVYRALATRLGGDRPVHGLDRLDHLADVPERAAEYAQLVRRRHPNGPWAVGGWSYGGVVAQHLARLLAPHGTVTALVLIDSVLPLPAPALTARAEARRRFAGFAAHVEHTYGSPLPLPYEELAELDDAAQIDLVVKALEQAVDLPAAVLRHQRASYLDLRSGERHTPGRHPGPTLLYQATDPAPHTVRDARYERDDPGLGWPAHCPELTVRHIRGHHLSLLDPPAVDALAQALRRDLAAHDPS